MIVCIRVSILFINIFSPVTPIYTSTIFPLESIKIKVGIACILYFLVTCPSSSITTIHSILFSFTNFLTFSVSS